jgi:hypothetical protein
MHHGCLGMDCDALVRARRQNISAHNMDTGESMTATVVEMDMFEALLEFPRLSSQSMTIEVSKQTMIWSV